MKPVYRIFGWSRRGDIDLGSCVFSIELDARFAEKARKFSFEKQRAFENLVRDNVGYKYARAAFLADTAFLRSMEVEGNCACLGVSGDILDSDWSKLEVIKYEGHNVDSKEQAYDLLTIFTYWIDFVDALVR
jgi:hypothetical protein